MQKEQFSKTLFNTNTKTSPVILFTGFVSGIISRTLTSPLERLRVMQQVSQKPYNQLGIAQSSPRMFVSNNKSILIPRQLKEMPFKPVQMACGVEHSLFLAQDG